MLTETEGACKIERVLNEVESALQQCQACCGYQSERPKEGLIVEPCLLPNESRRAIGDDAKDSKPEYLRNEPNHLGQACQSQIARCLLTWSRPKVIAPLAIVLALSVPWYDQGA
jgi:hypothetical protein